MRYGFFDDANREYVITTPETPSPWINYSGNQEFFSLISNTAGGYCFYKDARLRRITRYRYNNVPVDTGGDISTSAMKTVTSGRPAGLDQKKLDGYECEHGLGYTRIYGEKNGIGGEVLIFVPQNFSGEVHWSPYPTKTAGKKDKAVFIH